MLWLILAIINAVGYAICGFCDNYITDVIFKGKKQECIKLFYGITYLITGAALFLIFGIEQMDVGRILWLLFAGAVSSTASIPYYRALKDEETTTASIFLQVIPIIYLIGDFAIFGEEIGPRQLLAFFIIILAPIVVIFSRRRKSLRKMEITAGLLLMSYAVLAAASGLITTHAGEGHDFNTVFAYFVIGRGIMDLIYYFCNPGWRKRYKYVHKHDAKRLYVSLTAAQVIFLIAEFAGRYALIVGVPALVSVTSNALELIVVFVLGIVLSIIVPNFGREKLSKHIVLAHLVATILAVIGIVILQ